MTTRRGRMINKKMGVAAVLSAFTLLLLPANVFAAETAYNYRQLAKIVTEHAMQRDGEEFTVEYTGPESDVEKLMYDPSDFCFGTMSICDDPKTPEDADYVVGNIKWEKGDFIDSEGNTIHFKFDYYEKPEQTEYVREQVPAILEELNVAGMSNYEKVKTIHDYVCNRISYLDDNTDTVSSVYGAIKNGKGLCNSYALCMYRFLVEAGIPCKYVRGMAGNGRDADGHAWNMVALGDRWYLLDATWDDSEDGLSHDYFLKGTSDFDAVDPSEPHKLEKTYTEGEYAEKFPIAQTRFMEGMEDENKVIKIGGEDEPEEYQLSDVVGGTYPEDAYFSVKKKKFGELQVYFRKGMDELIKSVDYEITSGAKCVKNIELSELYVDEETGEYFCELSFRGRKKGKVDIDFIIELTNGQKLVQTFNGKIK